VPWAASGRGHIGFLPDDNQRACQRDVYKAKRLTDSTHIGRPFGPLNVEEINAHPSHFRNRFLDVLTPRATRGTGR
jgi:hypothetical protein